MSATATAARPARAAALPPPLPLPSGPLWVWFAARHPQADAAQLASRWQSAGLLFASGAVGEPDASSGARQVRSSSADDPNRPAGQPVSYTVTITARRPRVYSCECTDWRQRGAAAPTRLCKHILAVWRAVGDAARQQHAHGVLSALLASDRPGLLALLSAIGDGDEGGAAALAALLAGEFAGAGRAAALAS